jgi:hypothetical protein
MVDFYQVQNVTRLTIISIKYKDNNPVSTSTTRREELQYKMIYNMSRDLWVFSVTST